MPIVPKTMKKKPWRPSTTFLILCVLALAIVTVFLSLPTLIALKQQYFSTHLPATFPVTVNPKTKTIQEDPKVEAMFTNQDSGVAAAIVGVGDAFDMFAAAIAATPVYQLLSFNTERVVAVNPGFRKEEVALAFGNSLGWSKTAEDSLLRSQTATSSISEGVFFPDTYVVNVGASDAQVASLIESRFQSEIRSHYPTSTEDIVPMSDALTIASMIERETKDRAEMRLISGIIWNRIFANMKLQIDATLQYAKASKGTTPAVKNWWPKLSTNDKYIKSPYNTYQNVGLPPGPISNPSVAAVLAALNPKKTSCLFYFHDKLGTFHCSDTYTGHVALLKKYYGRGK